MVHRLEHVVDQLLEERVGELLKVDPFCDLAQRRVAVGDDLAEIGHGRDYTTPVDATHARVGPKGRT